MNGFQRTEAEIKYLAQNIVTGLTDNPVSYPSPRTSSKAKSDEAGPIKSPAMNRS